MYACMFLFGHTFRIYAYKNVCARGEKGQRGVCRHVGMKACMGSCKRDVENIWQCLHCVCMCLCMSVCRSRAQIILF